MDERIVNEFLVSMQKLSGLVSEIQQLGKSLASLHEEITDLRELLSGSEGIAIRLDRLEREQRRGEEERKAMRGWLWGLAGSIVIGIGGFIAEKVIYYATKGH